MTSGGSCRDGGILIPWSWGFVSFHSLPLHQHCSALSMWAIYGTAWVNFFLIFIFERKLKLLRETVCLKKFIQNFFVRKPDHLNVLFAHTKYMCEKWLFSSYNSEHGNKTIQKWICFMRIKDSKKQIEIGEIFLHIRCLCFIININIKGKLSEYFTMLFEKCFPRGSILFTVVLKTAFTKMFLWV